MSHTGPMSDTAVTPWSRQTWDNYIEQVRDSISEPDITIDSSWRTTLPRIPFVCPFCLHMQSGMEIAQPEGSASFTATWKDCGHAVTVEA